MADSFGNHAGFEDIPPSALTASHLAADHDVAARIAHGPNLLRREQLRFRHLSGKGS